METVILALAQTSVALFGINLMGLAAPEIIVMTGLMVALGVVVFALRQPRPAQTIRTVQGYATPQILYDEANRPAYYIWVKGKQLRSSARIFRRIQDGQRYEISYTPHTQQIVSARLI